MGKIFGTFFLLVGSLAIISSSATANDYSSIDFALASGVGLFSRPVTGDSVSQVYLIAIDPDGRKTGWVNVNGTLQPIAEIPNSDQGGDRIDSDIPGGSLGIDSVLIYLNSPVAVGTYMAVVTSTVSFPVAYALDMSFRDFKGFRGPNGYFVSKSVLPPGTTATYTINYNPAPGSAVSVVKIMSFPILRQELQATYELHQIGDKEFVDHLDKILAEGEKALAQKGDHGKNSENKKKAIEKLDEFIHQLRIAAKIKPEEKRESEKAGEREKEPEGEKRRFVTAAALASLTSDAQTLIQDLGGKPKREESKRR